MVATDSAFLLAALGTVVVVGGTALTGAVVVWRRAGRRWRALRRHSGVRSTLALVGVLSAAARREGGPALWRHQLWQSMAAFDSALASATADGVPAGDLVSLGRRLRRSATDVDRLLAMAGGLSPREPVVAELGRQVAEIVHASKTLRIALLATAGGTTAGRAAALVSDAEVELQAVSVGVARARADLSVAD